MTATRTKQIPLMRPYVANQESVIEGIRESIDSGWIGQGPKVDEFERQFSQRVDGRSSVAVSSCTAALHLSYLLAGIGPGDEVIAPLFTCTATNIPLLYCGAKIRFCDVAPGSLNVDPAAVARMMTERTKAIVVVHYGGAPVRLGGLLSGDGYRHVPVIEDCAQSLGSAMAGRLADFACFSFQAVKHVTTCDGGMLVLPEQMADQAQRMRWFGIDRKAKQNGTWANDISEVGYKYQMTDVGACFGLEGLKNLDAQIYYRRRMRSHYVRGLAGIDGIRLLDIDPESACWLCTVAAEDREGLRRKLIEHGVESDQSHYRNDRYEIFSRFRGEFPNMDAIEGKYLVLPMHMDMELEDVERICSVIRGGW